MKQVRWKIPNYSQGPDAFPIGLSKACPNAGQSYEDHPRTNTLHTLKSLPLVNAPLYPRDTGYLVHGTESVP